jgi:beta-glucanase (GH16 family)
MPSNRSRFSLVLLCSLVLSPFSVTAQEPIWRDEFDGERLDYSKWECEVNAFGGGNQELQIYTDSPKNVRVEDGKLIIEARREVTGIAGTTRDFSSGRIRTKHRGDWKYGRIDVRAKLPKGQGVWPAIWMMPTEDKYGGWALSGEIDIMEFKGQEPNRIHGTIHFGGAWPKNRFTTKVFESKTDYTQDFHVYSLDWREKKLTWLIDNEVQNTITKWDSDGGEFPAPFDQPFHLILNVAVGGGFVGPPAPNTPFPAKLEVDYVRVHK